jgi:hypothetical protein
VVTHSISPIFQCLLRLLRSSSLTIASSSSDLLIQQAQRNLRSSSNGGFTAIAQLPRLKVMQSARWCDGLCFVLLPLQKLL